MSAMSICHMLLRNDPSHLNLHLDKNLLSVGIQANRPDKYLLRFRKYSFITFYDFNYVSIIFRNLLAVVNASNNH